MSKATLTLVFTGSPSFQAPKRNTTRFGAGVLTGFRFNPISGGPPNTPKFCDFSFFYMTYLKSKIFFGFSQ